MTKTKIIRLVSVAFCSILAFALIIQSFGSSLVFASGITTTPSITVTKVYDGTSPFDANSYDSGTQSNPGQDSNDNNGIVRSGNSTVYQFSMSLNDPTATTPTP